jgi:hypothetical protein
MLAELFLAGVLTVGLSTVPGSTGVTVSTVPSPPSLACATTHGMTSGVGAALSCAMGAGDAVPPASLMPDSLFNRDVTSWPVASDSAAIVQEFDADWKVNYGNVGVQGRPVVWVPADQPMVRLSVEPGCQNFRLNTGGSAPIPPWAPTGGPPDYILTVYQPSRDSVWEFWQAHRLTGGAAGDTTGTGWSACWAGKASLRTFSGVFPWPYGETASGISNLATEVTEADVLSGSIKHAIGLQVVNCTTSVYPADRGDCSYHPGYPAEGQWFRFAPTVNCSFYSVTRFENEVCIAGQQRGFVVVDHGGSDGIEADYATGTWTDEGNRVPAGSWERNPRGGGCCIFAGGGGPLERAFMTSSETYEQEWQVIADLPWDQLQVIVPPHD